MRFGIFGDIHSNLEALEAVLEDMQAQAVTHTVCIGDIVGYNANPANAWKSSAPWLSHRQGQPRRRGLRGARGRAFQRHALSAIRYTRTQLTKEQREFLAPCPPTPGELLHVVHSTSTSPTAGLRLLCLEAESSFQYQKTNICFFGHTHVPHVFIRDTRCTSFLQENRHPAGEEIFRQCRSVGSRATATGVRLTFHLRLRLLPIHIDPLSF